MKSFKLLPLLAFLALFFVPSLLPAAEIRLAVAPSISHPQGMISFNEELVSFFPTNIFILNSQALRARAEAQLGQKVPASLQVVATRIPQTSIISITATGADDTIAAPFLSALVDQFLKYKDEQKKKYYTDAIRSANAALSSAPKEVVPQLTTYRDQLVMASLLDTGNTFEKSEF